MLGLHAKLRNVIHGSIHQEVIFTDSSRPPEGFIIIPEDERKYVRHAMQQMGGAEQFGAFTWDDELWLRPGPTIELFLNEGMNFTISVIELLSRELPSKSYAVATEIDDTDMYVRCAHLAGLTALNSFRFRDN